MSVDTPERWRKIAAAELKGKPPEELVWRTPEGIDVKPLYTAADLEEIEGLDSLPGVEPFLRGVRATMYAGRPGRKRGGVAMSRRRQARGWAPR